jgi:hypothetical protein
MTMTSHDHERVLMLLSSSAQDRHRSSGVMTGRRIVIATMGLAAASGAAWALIARGPSAEPARVPPIVLESSTSATGGKDPGPADAGKEDGGGGEGPSRDPSGDGPSGGAEPAPAPPPPPAGDEDGDDADD